MYMFELLSEFYMTQEMMESSHDDFMQIFSKSLQDKQTRVRTATFKALTTHLQMIEDEDLVLKFAPNMGNLLDILVEVIQADEEQGKQSLESLIELTNSFGEIWSQSSDKLIFVSSEVMKNRAFEDGTRESALELVVSVAEQHPRLLKDNVEGVKTQFMPALCVMMTKLENEEDLAAWYETEEEDVFLQNDIASRAAESLQRLFGQVGEAMTIQCSTQIMNEMLKAEKW